MRPGAGWTGARNRSQGYRFPRPRGTAGRTPPGPEDRGRGPVTERDAASHRTAGELTRSILHQEIPFSEAKIPVVVNVDAALVTDGAQLRDALIRQVTGAVRWTESMQLLIAEGITTFIEAGPGKVLSGLLRQIDRSQKCTQVEDPTGLEKLLAVLNA